MQHFPREYFQAIYFVTSLTTYQKNGGGKVTLAASYGLEISNEDLNSFQIFKLLLATDIFSLALLFAIFFFRRIGIIISMQNYAIKICEFETNHS